VEVTVPERTRRRRGEELRAALLDAAWDELVEVGYAKLTMESVAVRARTGIAVLYRRWANKDRLVLAAIEHHHSTHPIAVPDTGTLAGDLLALLTAMSTARAAFFAVAGASIFAGLLTDSGLTLAQARDEILGGTQFTSAEVVYRRAHERGEIDLERVPAALLTMPFDLVRHDLLMGLAPLAPARLHSIVEELFLPLAGDRRGSAG
jgi:AcrR family transcriptional regulator